MTDLSHILRRTGLAEFTDEFIRRVKGRADIPVEYLAVPDIHDYKRVMKVNDVYLKLFDIFNQVVLEMAPDYVAPPRTTATEYGATEAICACHTGTTKDVQLALIYCADHEHALSTLIAKYGAPKVAIEIVSVVHKKWLLSGALPRNILETYGTMKMRVCTGPVNKQAVRAVKGIQADFATQLTPEQLVLKMFELGRYDAQDVLMAATDGRTPGALMRDTLATIIAPAQVDMIDQADELERYPLFAKLAQEAFPEYRPCLSNERLEEHAYAFMIDAIGYISRITSPTTEHLKWRIEQMAWQEHR